MSIAGDVLAQVDERYLVISGDGHAGPPEFAGYRDCMEKRYLQQFDDFVDSTSMLADRFITLAPEEVRGYMAEFSTTPCSTDPGVRIDMLEADGIVAEVVFTAHIAAFAPLGWNMKGDAELQIAGARMQNRWLAEFCSTYPGRFAGIAVVPLRVDVDASVAELKRSHEAGLRGVLIPNPSILASDYPGYSDPVYDPFWSVCESLDMPVIHHPGLMGGFLDTNGTGMGSLYSMTMDLTAVPARLLSQMIFGGVFERHPKLKLVFAEIYADWVPGVLRDLDKVGLMRLFRHQYDAHFSLTPREYFQRQVYVAASSMSQWEFEHRDEIGVDRIVWGADLPHLEGTCPETREYLRMAAAGVPAHDMRLMLGENALRCFDFFDGLELRALADKVGPTVSELEVPLPQLPDTLHAKYSTSFEPRF